MQNLGNFELNFTKIDKKLRLQTNFTDVYESSKFYRKVISFRSMRLKGSTQNHRQTSQTCSQAQAAGNMFNNFISLLK